MICQEDFSFYLLIYSIIITFISFVYFKLEILNPIVILNSTFSISILFCFLNKDKWNLSISFDTMLFIAASMIAYFLGAYFFNNNNKICPSLRMITLNDVSMNKIVILVCVMLVALLFSIRECHDVSLKIGNSEGIFGMIKPLRYSYERGLIQFSRMHGYRYLFALSAALVSLYYFFYHLVCYNYSKLFKYLLPVICYIPFSILTTGRRDIIQFMLSGITIYGLLYLKFNNFNVNSKIRLIKIMLVTFIFSLILFLVLGTITGKVSLVNSNFYRIFSHYLGLSFPALDVLIHKPLIENLYIGQNTMLGVYSNLKTLGLNLEKGKSFLDFVYFNGINTNVYSVLGRQYMDYGITGTILLSFMLGGLMNFCYQYIKSSRYRDKLFVLYSLFGYIPFFLFIDDQFMALFNTRVIYQLIFIHFIFKLFRFTDFKSLTYIINFNK